MKLRNISVLLVLLLLAIGCTNASKAFRQGRYDDAINRCITVLHKEPSNRKHLDILRDAYRVADANDRERILSLRQSGQPDIWGNIVTIYERMVSRNRRINALPSSVLSEINFEYQSHSEELAEAKRRAAEFHYANGIRLLNMGTRMEARQAFAQFERVVTYAGLHFRDVQELRDRAEELGTVFVLFMAENRTNTFLPHEAIWHLTNIQPQQALNRRWIRYDTEPRRSHYQYEIMFVLERRFVFPMNINTRRFTENRTITDGTEVKTDSRGRPVLDSNGNVIRVPRQLNLRCDVTEITQQKRVRLDGSLTYFDVENQRVLRVIPLTRTFSAQSVIFSTHGDLRALSDQTRRRISAPFIPLPNDEEMLVWAARDLSEMVRETLSNNSNLIR
jgi:hypothetical protein